MHSSSCHWKAPVISAFFLAAAATVLVNGQIHTRADREGATRFIKVEVMIQCLNLPK